jgi:Ca2+-binding RTX toxin-like protein
VSVAAVVDERIQSSALMALPMSSGSPSVQLPVSTSNNLFGQKGNDLIISDTVGADLLSGGAGDDSCLSAFDGQDDDSVLGGDGEDTFNADDGDFVSTVENGPTPCEGG